MRWVTVNNPQGLHARPADILVRVASQYESEIYVIKDGEPFDAKSILSVLTLAAVEGTRLALKATGADAEDAVVALAELFERDFGEGVEPASSGPENEQAGSDAEPR